MVKVTGRAGLRRNFTTLKRFRASSLSPAARASLEPMRLGAKANAYALRQPGNPKGGHLDQGIVTRRIRSSARTLIYWVTLTRRALSIGHLVEFGTRPHPQPRRGIFHPGATPRPFFRDADAKYRAVVANEFARRTWQVMTSNLIIR